MKKKIVNVVLFLAVLAAALGMTFYVGNNAMSVLLYNFVFLGIIAVVYVVGLFGGTDLHSRLEMRHRNWKICSRCREELLRTRLNP